MIYDSIINNKKHDKGKESMYKLTMDYIENDLCKGCR